MLRLSCISVVKRTPSSRRCATESPGEYERRKRGAKPHRAGMQYSRAAFSRWNRALIAIVLVERESHFTTEAQSTQRKPQISYVFSVPSVALWSIRPYQ